jgi:hypothetical protein
MAALLLGVGLTLLAGILPVVSKWRPSKWRLSKHGTAAAATPRTPAPEDGGGDGASLIAFTAAFVLARFLTEGGR